MEPLPAPAQLNDGSENDLKVYNGCFVKKWLWPKEFYSGRKYDDGFRAENWGKLGGEIWG